MSYTRPPFSDLTADEWKELELRFDGQIPEQAALDKIRTRPVRDRAHLEQAIEVKLAAITQLRSWLLEDQQTGKSEWIIGTSRNAVIIAERALDALRAELAALPAERLAAE